MGSTNISHPPFKRKPNNKRRRNITTRDNHRRRQISLTNHLPRDLLIEILSHVASNSVTDLFNAKQTCKLMSQSGSHQCILRNAAVLHTFRGRLVPCALSDHRDADKYSSFVSECVDNENPEALFLRGIEECCFSSGVGFRNLRSAAERGLKEARYAYGIFSLFGGEEEGRGGEGLRFLRGLRKKEDVVECRETVNFAMLNCMWVNSICRDRREFRGLRLEEKKKKKTTNSKCGCDRRGKRLGCYSKNPDFEWYTKKEQVMELVDSGLCNSCFWEFEASVCWKFVTEIAWWRS